MKKLFFLLTLFFSISITTHAQDSKDKVKKTSTPTQKVHNTFSKHKHYKGYKVKHEHNGVDKKQKVDLKDGDVKSKTKK
jgi:hypothetical protein